MSEIGFKYELVNEAGEKVFSQAVSHERIGVVLKQIAESVRKHKNTTINMLEAHMADGKVMKDRKRMNNLGVMLTMAVEEYNRKKITVPQEESLIENLRTVLQNPKKRKKFVEALEDRCWKGYEPVPGKKPFSKGSCKPIEEDEKETTDTLTMPELKVGDVLLVGKFKNRAAVIKGFTTDEHGQPVAQTTKGDQKIFKPRVAKLMPGAEKKDDAPKAAPAPVAPPQA